MKNREYDGFKYKIEGKNKSCERPEDTENVKNKSCNTCEEQEE